MANWLQDVANFVVVATAAVPWHVFVFVAVAIYIAWRVWPRVYGILHLGTQMERLLDERRTLVDQVFPTKYRHLTPTTKIWAKGVIQRCIFFSLHAQQLLILIQSSLNASVDNYQDRHLELPTLQVGWFQYAAEVFMLYMGVRFTLWRLRKIQRKIEVRRLDSSLCLLSSDVMIQA
jgi:hypothetical protein